MGRKQKTATTSHDSLTRQLQELADYIDKLEEQNAKCTSLLEQQQAALDQIYSLSGEQLLLLRRQAFIINQFMAIIDAETALHRSRNNTP